MRQAAMAIRLQKSEALQEATRNADVIDLLSDDSDDKQWPNVQPDIALHEPDVCAVNDCPTDYSLHQACTSRAPSEMHSIRYSASQPIEVRIVVGYNSCFVSHSVLR